MSKRSVVYVLKIPEKIYDEIIEHAKKDAPLEACGYLAGLKNEVEEIYQLKNIDQSEEHFSFDPKEQFEVLKDARAKGLTLVAVYHSHPKSPARPSGEDHKLAFDPNLIYLIVSLLGEPMVKTFKLSAENQLVETDLKII